MKQALFLLFLTLRITLDAQFSDSSNIKLRITFSSAKLLEAAPEIPLIKNSRFFEAEINQQLNGAKAFHSYYGFPELGASIQIGNWGNKAQLGYSISAYPHMRFNIRKEKRWGLYFKVGLGFAFFTKPFDRYTNPQNVIIGSRITNITTAGGGISLSPLEQIELSAGYSFLHFSNGHSNVPNLGGNFTPLNLSLAYKPNKTQFRPKSPRCAAKPVRFNFRFATGRQEWYGNTSPVDGPKYRVWNFSPHLSKRVGNISDLHWGLSMSWYQQFYEYMQFYDTGNANKFTNSCVFAVFTGHEFRIQRFSGLIEVGFTFHNPVFEKSHVNKNPFDKPSLGERYLQGRAGLLYYFYKPNKNKHNALAFGMFIKSIGTKADYAEMCINYSL